MYKKSRAIGIFFVYISFVKKYKCNDKELSDEFDTSERSGGAREKLCQFK